MGHSKICYSWVNGENLLEMGLDLDWWVNGWFSIYFFSLFLIYYKNIYSAIKCSIYLNAAFKSSIISPSEKTLTNVNKFAFKAFIG